MSPIVYKIKILNTIGDTSIPQNQISQINKINQTNQVDQISNKQQGKNNNDPYGSRLFGYFFCSLKKVKNLILWR